MEARSADEIPVGDNWQYEPKWDGFRCLAFRDGNNVFLQSKAGQPLARYFPDIVTQIQALKAKRFVLDGELVIPIGTALSFDELQLRLHPAASRVQKLAGAHPALFIVFDLLADSAGKSLLAVPLRERRKKLESFARENLKAKSRLRLSPARAEPLEHGTQRRVGAGRSEDCRGSHLRSLYRRTVPARHEDPALAPR